MIYSKQPEQESESINKRGRRRERREQRNEKKALLHSPALSKFEIRACEWDLQK